LTAPLTAAAVRFQEMLPVAEKDGGLWGRFVRADSINKLKINKSIAINYLSYRQLFYPKSLWPTTNWH